MDITLSVIKADVGGYVGHSCSSTQRLALIAGRYVGKDDSVCIVSAQGKFPAVGEIVEPFASPIVVKGWMRGSHHGPLPEVTRKLAPRFHDIYSN